MPCSGWVMAFRNAAASQISSLLWLVETSLGGSLGLVPQPWLWFGKWVKRGWQWHLLNPVVSTACCFLLVIVCIPCLIPLTGPSPRTISWLALLLPGPTPAGLCSFSSKSEWWSFNSLMRTLEKLPFNWLIYININKSAERICMFWVQGKICSVCLLLKKILWWGLN